MNVFLTGATGVLGSQLIPYLKGKYSLTVIKHKKEPDKKNGIQWVLTDLVREIRLNRLLKNIDCVLHLAAVTHSNNIKRYFEVNEMGTLNLVKACEVQNIKHFIFLSTRAIDPAGGAYVLSKRAAENIVKNSNLNWTILRSAEVYGGNSSEMVDKLIYMVKILNVAPLLSGDGSAKIAPLYIDALIQFILQIILNRNAFKKTYTLTGPEEFTLEEFVDSIAVNLGKKNKPAKIKIPLKLFRLILELNAKLKLSKSLCCDQIDRLVVSKNSDFSLAAQDFGFNPLTLKQALKVLRSSTR